MEKENYSNLSGCMSQGLPRIYMVIIEMLLQSSDVMDSRYQFSVGIYTENSTNDSAALQSILITGLQIIRQHPCLHQQICLFQSPSITIST